MRLFFSFLLALFMIKTECIKINQLFLNQIDNNLLKEYIIDLNKPPNERYKEVLQDFKEKIQTLSNAFIPWLTPETLTYIDEHMLNLKITQKEVYEEI